MRPILIYLISCVGLAVCSIQGAQQAQGQSSQYAPGDPWTRGKLFKAQTKHCGFGYNCDGEEQKRNSPYIYWKTQTAQDLPACKSCWQRLSQTAAEVKQRIADGNCVQCVQAAPCQSCQQANGGNHCDCLDCLDCLSASRSAVVAPDVVARLTENENEAAEAEQIPAPPTTLKTITPRTAGLESLDIRVK